MRITLLGTGDAAGTPKIGCQCPQCSFARSTGIQRLRTSLLIEKENKKILIETTPDLRQQLLLAGSPRIDAVIWSHGHYDHFMGFGEFYRVQDLPRVFTSPGVLAYCGSIFGFMELQASKKKPFQPFRVCGLEVTLFPVNHPPMETYGLVIRDQDTCIGYTSDTNASIPDESQACLEDLDLLFIDALVPPGWHIPKHMNYEEAVSLAGCLRASDFRCVHMSHHVPFGLAHTGRDGECFSFRD